MKFPAAISPVDHRAPRGGRHAFTLLELLMVISIMAVLAALTLPAWGVGRSNNAINASQQLLDDVGRARQLAITHRTTVYMVFVSTNYWLPPYAASPTFTSTLTAGQMNSLTSLIDRQLTGYTFVSQGALGDQPGNHAWQYLAPWQALPQNNYIAGWKFQPTTVPTIVGTGAQQFTVRPFNLSSSIPFPDGTVSASRLLVPYIAFNYLGQLTQDGVNPAPADEYIPLAQGSVGYGYDGSTKLPRLAAVSPGEVTENPPGNSVGSMFTLVHIDALTGRARLEFQKVQ